MDLLALNDGVLLKGLPFLKVLNSIMILYFDKLLLKILCMSTFEARV